MRKRTAKPCGGDTEPQPAIERAFRRCLLLAIPAKVSADLCFEIMPGLVDATIFCADADLRVEGADGEPGTQIFEVTNRGFLSTDYKQGINIRVVGWDQLRRLWL